MIVLNFVLFLASFLILIQFSNYAVIYSSRISKSLHIPEFIVSFFIISLISVLPEATVSIISAINSEPGLGLGTLIGSNVADLTLVFGIAALFSSKGIKVKSKILSNNLFYLVLLLFPIILGFDGRFSRVEGGILILAGSTFFGKIYFESKSFHKKFENGKRKPFLGSFFLLIVSIAVLLLSSYYTVKYGIHFAHDLKIPALLIGVTILSLGTCLPELVFSIRAVRGNHDSLAIGDVLGTVITDATIILGIVAIISPFNYNPVNIYVTGGAMFLSGILATFFMKTDKLLNKFEALLLILFYIIFIFAEFFVNTII